MVTFNQFLFEEEKLKNTKVTLVANVDREVNLLKDFIEHKIPEYYKKQEILKKKSSEEQMNIASKTNDKESVDTIYSKMKENSEKKFFSFIEAKPLLKIGFKMLDSLKKLTVGTIKKEPALNVLQTAYNRDLKAYDAAKVKINSNIQDKMKKGIQNKKEPM